MKTTAIKSAFPYILIVLGFIFIYWTIVSARPRGKETNAIIKVHLCIISKNAVGRSQSDIERCYQVVEKATGVELIRYDKE